MRSCVCPFVFLLAHFNCQQSLFLLISNPSLGLTTSRAVKSSWSDADVALHCLQFTTLLVKCCESLIGCAPQGYPSLTTQVLHVGSSPTTFVAASFFVYWIVNQDLVGDYTRIFQLRSKDRPIQQRNHYQSEVYCFDWQREKPPRSSHHHYHWRKGFILQSRGQI